MVYDTSVSFRKFSAHQLHRKIVSLQVVSITGLSDRGGNSISVKCTWLCKGNACAKKVKTVVVITTTLTGPYWLTADSEPFSVWLHNKTCPLITLIFLRLLFRENYCPETVTMERCKLLHLQDMMNLKILSLCIACLSHFTA